MKETTKRRLICGISLGIFFAALILATVLLWDTLTEAVSDPTAFRIRMDALGSVGKLVFVGMMAAQVVLAIIPGHPFEVAAGYCFGIASGTLLTVVGALIGSAIAFWLARFLGAKTVKAFYSEEKLQKVSFLKESNHQILLSFIAFLIPGVPKDMLAYFLGLTQMKFRTFLLICVIGRLPGILVAVLGGAAAQSRNTTVIILFAALLLLTLLVSLLLYKKRSKPKKEDTERSE